MDFPELKNGDIVVTREGEKWIVVDHLLVSQESGFNYKSSYNENGLIDDSDTSQREYDIVKVYRNKTKAGGFGFNLANTEEDLIYERNDNKIEFREGDFVVDLYNNIYMVLEEKALLGQNGGYYDNLNTIVIAEAYRPRRKADICFNLYNKGVKLI